VKNSASGGIGDGVQHTIQGLLWIGHELAINGESMVVNVGKWERKMFREARGSQRAGKSKPATEFLIEAAAAKAGELFSDLRYA
jgi:hypothetical protein